MTNIPEHLYKFRELKNTEDLERIKDIIENGFYCCDFLNYNDMNEGVFSINQKNINIKLEDKLKYRICSFSGKGALNSQLMWGHYANAGMGIVIEVKLSGDAREHIKKVEYNNSRDNLNTIEEILTHKSKEWEYEHEFRYLLNTQTDIESNAESDIKDRVASNNKVKIGKIIKIHFGTPYENLQNYEEIKERHTKLKKYHELREKLKDFCKKRDIKCTYHMWTTTQPYSPTNYIKTGANT